MFKRFFFAIAPMLLVASISMANDDMLSMVAGLEQDSDSSSLTSQVEEEDVLGQADVDALLGEDDADVEEAVAACYRRFGSSYGYANYGSYSYRSYYSHCNYYTPSYHCYTPVTYTTYYTPVTYSCYSPCYTSYWGCW